MSPSERTAGVGEITDHDVYLFKEGSHFRLYEKFGSHVVTREGQRGATFAVWAPNASRVDLIGGFNGWTPGAHSMRPRADGSGIWEAFVPGIGHGALYKYQVTTARGQVVDKGDPYARHWELPPQTASVVWDREHEWGDAEWMAQRAQRDPNATPLSIYEVHAGSWRRVPEDGNRSLYYRELAHALADYCRECGFTHVELLPIMEHPFYGSWGYQTLGFFAPTGRYGGPTDFQYFVDHLHRSGIGVILDWVPSHFPADVYGLGEFDGTHLYEHADARQGWHPDWKSYIFNYGRHEVRAFLLSSALHWMDCYHADALRVDAVASMLYLDYSRRPGEWVPNEHGGRENVPAIGFLRQLNQAVYAEHPGAITIAEESTAWPMVSRPTYAGGLGFGMKWNMGWMHDTLRHFARDPVYRSYHYNETTFSIWYAFNENFVLALSHDEVVHGKGSLLGKMAGDDWQRFANLRLLLSYMWTHPGKKLLFMGGEFGQWREWNHDGSLDWDLLGEPRHGGVRRLVGDLNRLYRQEGALHRYDFAPQGFQWVNCHDFQNAALSYLRYGEPADPPLLVMCNLTPLVRRNYRVGVPRLGFWEEVLNTDAALYGGSGQGNLGGMEAAPVPFYDAFDQSLSVTLPPLATSVFRWKAPAGWQPEPPLPRPTTGPADAPWT